MRFVELFPEDQTHLFLALHNPATFIPAMMAEAKTDNLNFVMNKSDPRALRWSDLLKSMRERFPALPMTIWCTQDTPYLGAIDAIGGWFFTLHAYGWKL